MKKTTNKKKYINPKNVFKFNYQSYIEDKKIIDKNFPKLLHNEKIIVLLRYKYKLSIRSVSIACCISTRQVIKHLQAFNRYDYNINIPRACNLIEAKHLID